MALRDTDSTCVTGLAAVAAFSCNAHLFKARRKDMSMAALIPGLAVKVEGNYDELVATSVTFKRNDSRAGGIGPGWAPRDQSANLTTTG